MQILSEPVGSIPRSPELIAVAKLLQAGTISGEEAEPVFRNAVEDTVRRFEQAGSDFVTDGEQRKVHNFITYCVEGAPELAPGGFELAFDAGQVRVLPRLIRGPLRYKTSADRYVRELRGLTKRAIKQAVIAPSALSLLYPEDQLPSYQRDEFFADLVRECGKEVLACFAAGAESVQLDFTEGRLALKLDPDGLLLSSFIDLNNMALDRIPNEFRARVGVHTCPGSDCDSHHSIDTDYGRFIPELFRLNAGRFFMSLVCENDQPRILRLIRDHVKPGQRVYIGVIDPTDPAIETADQVAERVIKAAEILPLEIMGTTDDCGFSPFCDDITTSRDTAFAKIAARIEGTKRAGAYLAQRG